MWEHHKLNVFSIFKSIEVHLTLFSFSTGQWIQIDSRCQNLWQTKQSLKILKINWNGWFNSQPTWKIASKYGQTILVNSIQFNRSARWKIFAYTIYPRNDLTEEEYCSMKDETLEQIREFTATLDRLHKGDVTLNSKISSMRNVCTRNFI